MVDNVVSGSTALTETFGIVTSADNNSFYVGGASPSLPTNINYYASTAGGTATYKITMSLGSISTGAYINFSTDISTFGHEGCTYTATARLISNGVEKSQSTITSFYYIGGKLKVDYKTTELLTSTVLELSLSVVTVGTSNQLNGFIQASNLTLRKLSPKIYVSQNQLLSYSSPSNYFNYTPLGLFIKGGALSADSLVSSETILNGKTTIGGAVEVSNGSNVFDIKVYSTSGGMGGIKIDTTGNTSGYFISHTVDNTGATIASSSTIRKLKLQGRFNQLTSLDLDYSATLISSTGLLAGYSGYSTYIKGGAGANATIYGSGGTGGTVYIAGGVGGVGTDGASDGADGSVVLKTGGTNRLIVSPTGI